MDIRPSTAKDRPAIWKILKPVFRAGDTYAVDPHISRTAALAYWCGAPNHTFVAAKGNTILGTYYIHPNQQGGGAHVCNCGFATDPAARGCGVARTMLKHALLLARTEGYRAMQFNFVVATNKGAIHIWQSAGFETVGRLPDAFVHPELGHVDALVMFKTL